MNDFKMFLTIADTVTDSANFEDSGLDFINEAISLIEQEQKKAKVSIDKCNREYKELTTFFTKTLAKLKTAKGKHMGGFEKGTDETQVAGKAEFKFPIGTKVKKVTGDYTFPGTVIGTFTKLSGLQRYAVEDDRGAIHIYSEKNLALRED